MTNPIDYTKFTYGTLLKIILKETGLSQVKLAKMIGVQYSYVSKWANRHKLPDYNFRKEISDKCFTYISADSRCINRIIKEFSSCLEKSGLDEGIIKKCFNHRDDFRVFIKCLFELSIPSEYDPFDIIQEVITEVTAINQPPGKTGQPDDSKTDKEIFSQKVLPLREELEVVISDYYSILDKVEDILRKSPLDEETILEVRLIRNRLSPKRDKLLAMANSRYRSIANQEMKSILETIIEIFKGFDFDTNQFESDSSDEKTLSSKLVDILTLIVKNKYSREQLKEAIKEVRKKIQNSWVGIIEKCEILDNKYSGIVD